MMGILEKNPKLGVEMGFKFDLSGVGFLLQEGTRILHQGEEPKMARTATGNKKGKEAFAVLMQWREDGVPEFVTSYEAWNLTGGLVGKQNDSSEMRLIDVAMNYANHGGSVRDQLALKAGA